MVSAGELILMEPKVLHHRKKQIIGSVTFNFEAIFSKDFFLLWLIYTMERSGESIHNIVTKIVLYIMCNRLLQPFRKKCFPFLLRLGSSCLSDIFYCLTRQCQHVRKNLPHLLQHFLGCLYLIHKVIIMLLLLLLAIHR